MVIVIADGLSRFRAVISIPDAGRYVVFVYQVTGIPCDATYLFFRSGGTYRPRIVTSVNQGRDTYCTVLEYAGDTASVIVERLSFPAVACDGTDVVAVYNTS